MKHDTTVIEAVGLANKPGRNTIKADCSRLLKRLIVWVLFRAWIPLEWRQWALFSSLAFVNRTFTGRSFVFAGASKGDTFENDLLKLIFQATAISLIADNTATTPLTNLYVSLHTADPGESGDQSTSQISYTGYARQAVLRTSGGWTVTNNSVSPVANIDFPVMTAGAGGTVTHFVVGTVVSASGKILYSGTVTPNISVVNGVIPRLTTASAITED